MKELGQRNTSNPHVIAWVEQMAGICKPDRIYWCDGSERENERFLNEAVGTGILTKLDQNKLPGCYYHRSNPNDTARTEQCTFVCTEHEEDAGPTNNWAPPREMYAKLHALCDGSMRGRTMYVMPYLMGPPGSRLSKVGIQLTDSI